jgi:hypothetical protein
MLLLLFTTETKTMIVICFPITFEVFVTGRVFYRTLTYILNGTMKQSVVVRKRHCCSIHVYSHSLLRTGSPRSTACYLPVYSYTPLRLNSSILLYVVMYHVLIFDLS